MKPKGSNFAKKQAAPIVLVICLLIMILSSAIGYGIQTGWGSVKTEEIIEIAAFFGREKI